MGVDIDETGSDYSSLSVQGTSRRLLDLTYGDDPSVADPDTSPLAGPTCPVDDLSVADHEVKHRGHRLPSK